MRATRYSVCLSLLSALACWLVPTVAAQAALGVQDDQPILMQADKLGYDSKNKVVVAIGNVEVFQGDTILLADRIAYYQDQDVVRARGNVTLLEDTGTVYFAREVELKDQLKRGVVQNFRIRLVDNSLFAAREAARVSDTRTKLKKAVYSACKVCESYDPDSDNAPLWQIKANKVTIDEEEEKVTYRDAYMEVYGLPVAYTPYFSHPTPNASRKSGILTPEYSQNSQLGTVVQVPYYWNIAPDKDATITPHLTSEEGLVMEGEYRQLTDNGAYKINGSVTYPRKRDEAGLVTSGHELRGHIFANGNSRISQNWSWGFDVNRTTDDTYLRRYRFGSQDTLTSRVFAERLQGRDYITAQGLSFQGLEIDDDPDTIPLVLPNVMAHFESRPMWKGSRFVFDADTGVITREVGAQSRRATLNTAWSVPFVTKGGHVFEAGAALRSDVYSVSDVTRLDGSEFDGTETRFVPQGIMKWKYPMIKQLGTSSIIVEPLAEMVISSNGNNPDTIPNEDSLNPEFSDINLFTPKRFAGVDRIENGSRAMYGVRGQWQIRQGRNVDVMLGQNYSLSGDPIFPLTASGSEPDLSDYVGRVGVQVDPVQMSYRFRLDHDDLGVRRSELRGSYSGERFGAHVDYIYIDDDPFLENEREIIAAGSVRLSPEWTFNAAGQRDLVEDRAISASTGLTYQNECITVQSLLAREFTRDRDIEPNTSFSVRLLLKNLN